MKKFIILLLNLLILTAITPIAFMALTGQISSKPVFNAEMISTPDESDTKSDENSDTSQTAEKTTESNPEFIPDKEKIVTLSMQYIDGNTPLEAKKAIMLLIKHNFSYLRDNSLADETSNVSAYSDDLYEELCELYDGINANILYNGKKVYIPIVKSSGTNTGTSDEYPYMSAVATPWDTYLSSYDRRISAPCGVSVSGLCYLCDSGYDCLSALYWYLPDFDISIA